MIPSNVPRVVESTHSGTARAHQCPQHIPRAKWQMFPADRDALASALGCTHRD